MHRIHDNRQIFLLFDFLKAHWKFVEQGFVLTAAIRGRNMCKHKGNAHNFREHRPARYCFYGGRLKSVEGVKVLYVLH